MAQTMIIAPSRCMPFTEWPAKDRTAWHLAQEPGDALEPGGLAATWSKVTRTMAANGYGRWLTWLEHRGLLDSDASPDQRISKERLSAYWAELAATNAPFSVQTRIRQLGMAVRAMAPRGDWRWILRGADRLRAVAQPARDKLARLQSPDRLVDLGRQIMSEADGAIVGRSAWIAADFRDGLIIALLAWRPLRRDNFAMIQCGRHLTRRAGLWRLTFTAAETKTDEPIDIPFPAELVPHLGQYLTVYRPVLLEAGARNGRDRTDALWVSAHGRGMSAANITLQVRQRTGAAFGKPINPHLFRDCVATAIAIAVPEEIQLILPILGHRSLKTSEKHYNQARSLEAGRRYHQTIGDLRRRVHGKRGTTGQATFKLTAGTEDADVD